MGRVSSHLFTISYCVFSQPLGFLSSLFQWPCVFRICLMPQPARSLTSMLRDLLAAFLGQEADTAPALLLHLQIFKLFSSARCPCPQQPQGEYMTLNHHPSSLKVKKNPKVCLWVFKNTNFSAGSWSCAQRVRAGVELHWERSSQTRGTEAVWKQIGFSYIVNCCLSVKITLSFFNSVTAWLKTL